MTKLTTSQLLACLDIINQSLTAKNEDDVKLIWQQLRTLCGIKGLALSVAETADHAHIKIPCCLHFGFPEGWFERYIGKQYVLVDPVVKMGFNQTGVFTWQQAFEAFGDQPTSQAFLQDAMQHELYAGFAVATEKHPISNTASVCSVSVANDISTVQMDLLYRILPHLNEIVARPGFLHAPELTSREHQVITLADGNLLNTDIAERLSLTPRTVKFHFNNIYQKLGVNNKPAAIRKAKILGILK